MLYTISDPHLSLSCDKPMDIFGARWQDYTKKLEENWKSTVLPDDTVVLPGDISWGMTLEEAAADLKFLDGLPGKKIIGKGNHDYWWDTVAKMERFKAENGIGTIDFLYNNAFYAEGRIICGTRGWNCESPMKAEDMKILNRENQRLRISLEAAAKLKKDFPDAEIIPFLHFPPAVPGVTQEMIFDTLLEFGIERLYYGHLHGVYSESGLCNVRYGILMQLVSCDRLNFTPLSIN